MTQNKITLEYLQGKRILITGVCGTVGSKLLSQLFESGYNVSEVIGLDNNESGLFYLEQEFLHEPKVKLFLADIRDKDKMLRIMKGIDIVFHTAALKHVILCERSPYEAVQTNIEGVNNLIYAAQENNTEKVIFTSSDKAVNPTNVMGTTKLMGERLMTAANSTSHGDGTVFASTRFGNVLGSTGSVIPIFREQISKGGPITLTDSGMTRFVMSIQQAVNLVIESVTLAKGGDVLITKMPVINIKDLAEVMVSELAEYYGYDPKLIEIMEIGTKPGEKLYEELMSSEEMRRTVELEKFFSVLPAFRGVYRDIKYDYSRVVSVKVEKPYNSAEEKVLTKSELVKFLTDNELLYENKATNKHIDKRYWPGEED